MRTGRPAKLAIFIVSIILSVAPFVCVGDNTVVRITGKDAGKEFAVPAGAVFRLELKEPGATGYLWDFETLDGDFFEVMRADTVIRTEKGLVGAPVIRIWDIRAKRPGVKTLRMLLFRPWEGKGSAEEVFAVTIRIT